jgi:sugar lactone lactonase YvrE
VNFAASLARQFAVRLSPSKTRNQHLMRLTRLIHYLSLMFALLSAATMANLDAKIARAAPATKVYWTDASLRNIARANPDGTLPENLITAGLVNPEGIALDPQHGKMYWGQESTGIDLKRANLDGSNVENLVSSGGIIDDVDLDIAGGKIYWVDSSENKIQRANLDGTNVEDVISTGLDEPIGLALDLAHNKVYFTNRNTPNIQRANLDGSGVETLVSSSNEEFFDVDLDLAAGKMYWTTVSFSPFFGAIRRANLDGSEIEQIETLNSGFPAFIDLDTASNRVYWTVPDPFPISVPVSVRESARV